MIQRDNYVDIAKGICILLIVCIHTEVFSVVRMPITFIAVPMFFFMAGFYDRSSKSLIEVSSKSLRTIILPAIIWVFAGLIYSELLAFLKERQFHIINLSIYNPCNYNGPAWFLFALFYVKLFVWALSKIKVPKYVIMLGTLALGYIGSTYQMPLLIDEALAALPLYYAGKLAYPNIRSLISNWLPSVIGIAGIVLFLTGLVYYTIVPINNGCYRPYYLIGLLTVVSTFFTILYFSEKLKSVSFLSALGQKSLGIMLLHAPMCHTAAVILNRICEVGSTTWIACFLVAYVFIVCISYYMTVLIERYCPILLGKKK